MSVHLHRARQWTAWFLGALVVSPFALCVDLVGPSRAAPVTGRVTFSGRPVSGMLICLDSEGNHSAFARLESDGTFRLINMNWLGDRALEGRFHAHLHSMDDGRTLPAKFDDSRTSGLEVTVTPGWNDIHIDLH